MTHFIREWRQHRGLSQKELGRSCGLTSQCISQLETGVINYNEKTLEAVAEALGVTPGTLLDARPAGRRG